MLRQSRQGFFRQRDQGLFSKFAFKEFQIHEYFKRTFDQVGLKRATAIQAKAFCPISAWRDAKILSQTGSGKTIAYLLPLMNRALIQLENKPETVGYDLLGRATPPAVVLCPTLELCKQVLSVAAQLDCENRLSKQTLTDLKIANVMTGPRIRWGAVDLVVSTPVRFAEDIQRFKEQRLKPCTVVFDEADMLLEGACQSAVTEILDYLRPKPKRVLNENSVSMPCQFVFVSATMPKIGMKTAGPLIDGRFGTADLVQVGNFHAIPSNISSVEWVPELEGDWANRCHLLTKVLQPLVDSGKKVLVFVNTTRNSVILYQFLKEKKWPVANFTARNASGDEQVIVATDVAARGIDWNGIETVVNFQMPTDVVTWLHRAGRCGRLGRSGSVVSIFKAKEEPLVQLVKERVKNDASLEDLFSHKRSLRRKISNRKTS